MRLRERHDVEPALVLVAAQVADQTAFDVDGDRVRVVRVIWAGAAEARIWVYFNLDPNGDVPWNDQLMRDVSDIGHYGLGDTEYNLSSADQLDEVKRLVQLAYERTR